MDRTAGVASLAGAVGAIMGTMLALTQVPLRPQGAGVLASAGTVMAVCFSIGPLCSAYLQPRNFLRIENIIGLAPIYWLLLDLIQGTADLEGVSEGSVKLTFLSIGLFTTFFWLGTAGRAWQFPAYALVGLSQQPKTGNIFSITCFLFAASMTSYLIPCNGNVVLMFTSLFDVWGATPWSRGDLGGWRSFGDHLVYFGYLLPTMTVMLAGRRSWVGLETLAAGLMSGIFLLFIANSGSRRIMGVCLGAAMIYWVLEQRHIKFKQMAVVVLLVGGLVWLMQFMLVARSIGFTNVGQTSTYVTDSMTGKKENQFSKIRVDDNFYRICQLNYLIPSRQPYMNFNYIGFILIRPIPRALWRNKPVDPGFALHQITATGASLSTTLVGELYMSRGFWALMLGGFLYGRVTRWISPLFNSPEGSWGTLFYGYAAMTMFSGYRSMQEIMLCSYVIMGWLTALYFKYRDASRVVPRPSARPLTSHPRAR